VLFEFYDTRDQVAPPDCRRASAPREISDLRYPPGPIRDYQATAALTARILMDQLDLE
jgi:hypothetical protein